MQKGLESKRVDKKYIYERNIWAVLVALSLMAIFLFRNSDWGLRVASAIEIFAIFVLGGKIFSIGFKKRHFIFMGILIVANFIASPLYFIYPSYDKFWHLIGPLIVCSIAFFMINKLNISMKWKVTFTFFTAFALLGIFELWEYSLDSLFNFQLQGVYLRDAYGLGKLTVISERIDDTMLDLFLGVIGTAAYCAFVSWIYKVRTHKHLLNYA